MEPINFKQCTKVLQRPSSMSKEECQSLPVWSDGKQCVSCWKPSLKERLKLIFGGRVWVGVLSGGTQPPIFISGENVFYSASIKDHLRYYFYRIVELFQPTPKNAKKGTEN